MTTERACLICGRPDGAGHEPRCYTEKCPHCWAMFTTGFDHQCPPFLVALVKLHNEKKNTIEPDK